MAKFEIDSLKQNESFSDLDFTQNEYELYQKFFKTNSPLVAYFARRNKHLTVPQSESSDYGHAIRHISVDPIPYVNQYANLNSIGQHDGLMRSQDKVKFDEMVDTLTGGTGQDTALGSTLLGDKELEFLVKVHNLSLIHI